MATHAPLAPLAPTALSALVRSTIPEPEVTYVPDVVTRAVAYMICNAICASGNITILSSTIGLLQVHYQLHDGTDVESTLASYLTKLGLQFKNIRPIMVAHGLVQVVGAGSTMAFALPGTFAAPLAHATLGDVKVGLASNDAPVPPIPLIVIDFITRRDSTKLSLIMLQPSLAEAVKSTGCKIGVLMKADKRVVVSGSLGNVSVSMAGFIQETVPLPVTDVEDIMAFNDAQVSTPVSVVFPLPTIEDVISSGIKGSTRSGLPTLTVTYTEDTEEHVLTLLEMYRVGDAVLENGINVDVVFLNETARKQCIHTYRKRHVSAGGRAAGVPALPVSAGGRAAGVPSLPVVNTFSASAFGNRSAVKSIVDTSGMSLKALIASVPSHEMRMAVRGRPGTDTIYARTVPGA